MTKKYKLRQAAINDLRKIGSYTLQNYGINQRNSYLTGLKDRFELLGENPQFGRPRNDVKEGYLCSEYKEHVVFYSYSNHYTEILAVLHKSMLPDQHL